MKEKKICGIQQVGIGVPDCEKGWRWYHDNFGFDVKIVDADGVAERMLPYTGGKPQPRRSMIALNVQGGGGFEIWQPKERELNWLFSPVQLGDLGLLEAKVKCPDAGKAFEAFRSRGLDVVGSLRTSPSGLKWFSVRDPWGNLFRIEEDGYIFCKLGQLTGGAGGMVIGVSDMDSSVAFYSRLLDYDKVCYDGTAVFEDLAGLPGGGKELRRVILARSKPIEGPLSPLFGTSCLELIQATGGPGKKLYADRYWGDPGFIHLCFDVRNMAAIKAEAEALGHPFVCDSGADFEMGDANGHFTYVEDPDGTLIEFVETFKVPLSKRPPIVLDLTKKDDSKPLKFLKALRFLRSK